MLGKLHENSSRELFRTRLEDLINPQHELAPLAKKSTGTALKKSSRAFIRKNPAVRVCRYD
jgi:hypothetical protein